MQKYVGRLPAVLFALALIDASIIGASAVSLSTAYAISDVFKVNHSLHRKPGEAKFFYVVYGGLLFGAAARPIRGCCNLLLILPTGDRKA